MGNLNLGALRNKSGEKNKEKRLTITGKGNKKEKGEKKKNREGNRDDIKIREWARRASIRRFESNLKFEIQKV